MLSRRCYGGEGWSKRKNCRLRRASRNLTTCRITTADVTPTSPRICSARLLYYIQNLGTTLQRLPSHVSKEPVGSLLNISSTIHDFCLDPPFFCAQKLHRQLMHRHPIYRSYRRRLTRSMSSYRSICHVRTRPSVRSRLGGKFFPFKFRFKYQI